jgi:hypothetical protein
VLDGVNICLLCEFILLREPHAAALCRPPEQRRNLRHP